jgi:hypothetical protein
MVLRDRDVHLVAGLQTLVFVGELFGKAEAALDAVLARRDCTEATIPSFTPSTMSRNRSSCEAV